MNATHSTIQVDMHACGEISLKRIFMPEVQKRYNNSILQTTCFELSFHNGKKSFIVHTKQRKRYFDQTT